MTAGVPVVASRVGGVPELAPPGTALLVRPGDPAQLAAAIARLLDEPGLAQAQRAAARGHIEATGGAPAMVAQTLALYERLR
jgi:glycosyltransferase involved in cell wall biosynthesis